MKILQNSVLAGSVNSAQDPATKMQTRKTQRHAAIQTHTKSQLAKLYFEVQIN